MQSAGAATATPHDDTWRTKGSATGALRTLDFGAETCDNKANLTVEGKTTTITL